MCGAKMISAISPWDRYIMDTILSGAAEIQYGKEFEDYVKEFLLKSKAFQNGNEKSFHLWYLEDHIEFAHMADRFIELIMGDDPYTKDLGKNSWEYAANKHLLLYVDHFHGNIFMANNPGKFLTK